MSNLLRIVSTAVLTSLIAAANAAAASPWSGPVAVAPGAGDARALDLASDAAGNLTAAWVDGTRPHVFTATRPAGSTTWSPVTQLDGDSWPVSPFWVSISVSPNGHALASWLRRGLPGDHQLETATRTPQGTWGERQTVLPANTGSSLSNVRGLSLVATDTGGALGVVARSFFGPRPYDPISPTTVLAADLSPGGTWTTREGAGAPTSAAASTPSVAIDDLGNAVAIGQNERGGVSSWTRAAGGAWAPAGDFAPAAATGGFDVEAPATDLQLEVAAGGVAVASWKRMMPGNGSGIDSLLQSARLPRGGAWSAVTDVDRHVADGFASNGALGVDAQGNATLVWDDLSRSGDTWSANVLTSSSTGTGAWSTPSKLAPTITASQAELQAQGGGAVPSYSVARVAVGRGGGAASLWQFYSGGDDQRISVGGALRPAGGSWQTVADMGALANVGSADAIAVDPLGQATLLRLGSDGLVSYTADVSGRPAPIAGPRVRINLSLIPVGTRTCPATVSVNVAGAKTTLPTAPWDAGATSGPRCRVSGDVVVKSTTKPGTYSLAFVTGKSLLPGIQFVRVFK